MKPEPYYQDDLTTLYCGDCRDILPTLRPAPVLITDPVWPNTYTRHEPLKGADNPTKLFRQAMETLPGLPVRLVVILRLDSDPRFLCGVPSSLPFFRVQMLRYDIPGYVGRKLGGFEVAYGFGQPIKSEPGRRCIPGLSCRARPGKDSRLGHPCPRSLAHMEWLIKWWTEPGDVVLDPFAGSGTTLLAARNLGRASVGIEIEESYCQIAAQRLRTSWSNYAQGRVAA
jgi:site-specific DNA-methyltransferase (adenine-specific)